MRANRERRQTEIQDRTNKIDKEVYRAVGNVQWQPVPVVFVLVTYLRIALTTSLLYFEESFCREHAK